MNNVEQDELRKLWPDAWNVMHDRLHDMPVALLIELLLHHMPYGEGVRALTKIQDDISESRMEEELNELRKETGES